jgi:Lrp/AsnC family transcriptional regulator, leucine-responsive regulatory protein
VKQRHYDRIYSVLDEIDRQILTLLQDDGRISNAELARRIDLSPPATYMRLKSLEEEGYVRRYVALLEPEKIGFDLMCFVQVALQLHSLEQIEAFRRAILEMPEVLECYHLTGEYDYLLKVVVRNRKELETFLLERLTPVPGVARIHTSMVLSEVKQTTALPILSNRP